MGVAAKDSALIVSHYELHKEKLMRDRLEQKNLKLMDRLQKLMMVVETQRREQENTENQLADASRICEDKDRQLADITTKAMQLQQLLKAQAQEGKGRGTKRKPKRPSFYRRAEPDECTPG